MTFLSNCSVCGLARQRNSYAQAAFKPIGQHDVAAMVAHGRARHCETEARALDVLLRLLFQPPERLENRLTSAVRDQGLTT